MFRVDWKDRVTAQVKAAGTVTVRMGLVWRTPREAARFPPP